MHQISSKNSDWHLLFIDDSKSDDLPAAFAVVGATGQVKINHIPHESVSTFTTEASGHKP